MTIIFEEMNRDKIIVGYLFSEKKFNKLKLIDLVKESTRSGLIELVAIDPYKTLFDQNLHQIDMIIHRVHDYVNNIEDIDPDKYLANLNYEVSHYGIVLLDVFERVNLLADRKKCLEMLEPISCQSFHSFILKLPPTLEIEKGTSKSIVVRLIHNFLDTNYPFKNNQKSTPFLVKTTKCVYSNDNRYRMGLYFHTDSDVFDDITDIIQDSSIVVQPFYNHNGILYKLFILDNKWHLAIRPSIKNFDFNYHHEKIKFMSNKVSKTDSKCVKLHDEQDLMDIKLNLKSSNNKRIKGFYCQNFDWNDLDKLVTHIKTLIPCPLLGVDLLLECNTRNLYIIDINYFPGYDGFTDSHDLGEAFIDLFIKYSKKK